MPVELFSNCDTYKYFNERLDEKMHLKWMLDLGYIEHYMMFGADYQFVYDSLDLLVEKVIGND